jgi:predicted amidohydrolase
MLRAMPQLPLRLAIAQQRSQPGDVAGNVAASVRTIAAARERGAVLAVFPELSLTGYDLAVLASEPSAWVGADDPRLEPLQRACAEAGMVAVVGAPMRTDAARITALIVDASGAITVSQKVHLHSSEDEVFAPGVAAPPFTVAGWRVSVAICFDAARPQHAAAAAAAGTDLYLVSALYEVGQERRLDLHHGARAMDHRMFAALANHAGTTGGYVSCGGSGLWSPSGAQLASAPSSDEALLIVDLDPAELARWRA